MEPIRPVRTERLELRPLTRQDAAALQTVRGHPEPPLPGSIPTGFASLGYLLHPDHHGKGYGREAAGALVH